MVADAVATRLDGVVIGMLTGFAAADGAPLVVFPGSPTPEPAAARSLAALGQGDIGAEVALLFEAGDPRRPVVAGRLLRPGAAVTAERDGGRRLDLTAEREVTLRCGKASITLTEAGKVLIRGTYVSSRSSGVNKIKGGSVQLN